MELGFGINRVGRVKRSNLYSRKFLLIIQKWGKWNVGRLKVVTFCINVSRPRLGVKSSFALLVLLSMPQYD